MKNLRVVKGIGVAKPRKKVKPKKFSTLKRGGKIRPNAKRQRRLFSENFGGEEFLALIHSLPCAVCGVEGFTVAAHLKSRGAGGKAEDIAPLCCTSFRLQASQTSGTPWGIVDNEGTYYAHQVGCHERYDAHDPEIRKHEIRLRAEAKKRWMEFQSTPLTVSQRSVEK